VRPFSQVIENCCRTGCGETPTVHTSGFALANKGHDTRALQAYLGRKNIQHTVRYTELAPTRFKDFWR
jgi:site-specific recombinase XerD